MHAHRASLLRNTRNRCLHLFSCLHDEVSILVNNHHYVWEVLVMQFAFYQFIWIESALGEFIVIILKCSNACSHQQFVSVLHLNNEGVEGIDHLIAIGDYHLVRVGIRHSCEVMFEERFVWCKLNHFRIHKHHFKFRRVLFVEQRSDDSIDSDGFTGTCCACNEEVWCLSEVEHKDLIGDGSSVCDRQFHLLLILESFGGDNGVHRDGLWRLIRHLYTYRSFTRHWCDDTNARCREREHDIILK